MSGRRLSHSRFGVPLTSFRFPSQSLIHTRKSYLSCMYLEPPSPWDEMIVMRCPMFDRVAIILTSDRHAISASGSHSARVGAVIETGRSRFLTVEVCHVSAAGYWAGGERTFRSQYR